LTQSRPSNPQARAARPAAQTSDAMLVWISLAISTTRRLSWKVGTALTAFRRKASRCAKPQWRELIRSPGFILFSHTLVRRLTIAFVYERHQPSCHPEEVTGYRLTVRVECERRSDTATRTGGARADPIGRNVAKVAPHALRGDACCKGPRSHAHRTAQG
jgi:hypothetical protein